jgi:hypothetical protein
LPALTRRKKNQEEIFCKLNCYQRAHESENFVPPDVPHFSLILSLGKHFISCTKHAKKKNKTNNEICHDDERAINKVK